VRAAGRWSPAACGGCAPAVPASVVTRRAGPFVAGGGMLSEGQGVWLGATEEVALSVGGAQTEELVSLRGCFDAFCDEDGSDLTGEGDHRAGDSAPRRVLVDVGSCRDARAHTAARPVRAAPPRRTARTSTISQRPRAAPARPAHCVPPLSTAPRRPSAQGPCGLSGLGSGEPERTNGSGSDGGADRRRRRRARRGPVAPAGRSGRIFGRSTGS
jgi:hypothetical protein